MGEGSTQTLYELDKSERDKLVDGNALAFNLSNELQLLFFKVLGMKAPKTNRFLLLLQRNCFRFFLEQRPNKQQQKRGGEGHVSPYLAVVRGRMP